MKKYTISILTLFISLIISHHNFAQKSKDSSLTSNFTSIEEHQVNKMLRLDIKSSINPATLDYLTAGFNKSVQENYGAILIVMNTPGGLVSTTKKILNLIGSSQIPVIIWISPEGSSATSAGAIISSGAHLLYMSEGTNIGAATPVQIGKDVEESDLRRKSINDLVALVTSLSKSRKRNADGFKEMIEKASSFDSQTALKTNLIDGIVNTELELRETIDGKIAHVLGKDKRLAVPINVVIEKFEMDLGQKLLDIFANPSLAYILFLIGAALIYFELQAPGGFIAGAIGVVFLTLAGIGFQVLPLNFGGLGLILLSFVLFILEIYVTSYGILSIAGLTSMVAGSLFLFRTNDSYLELSKTLIFSSTGAIGVFLGLIAYLFIRESKNIGKETFNEFIGKVGTITTSKSSEGLYQIKVGGEFWKCKSERSLKEGETAKVVDHDKEKMCLIVE